MNKKFVIDTSVFITYAAYNKIYRLVDAIISYELKVFLNDELLLELENNIRNALQVRDADPYKILHEIKEVTIHKSTIPYFKLIPDPKDNFLFDLALQTGSEVIVTQEKALLNFKDSPVPIHNIGWFKENFPVSL